MLKVLIDPSFMSPCEIEIKGQDLIILKSSMEALEKSQVHHSKIDSETKIKNLLGNLMSSIHSPTPHDSIVIADGLNIRITYNIGSSKGEVIWNQFPKSSSENEFVHHLFNFCIDEAKHPDLKDYFQEIIAQHLS